MTIQYNKKSPDFQLKDKDEKVYQLKDFAGKRVVFFFYPKDNTPGCTKEACKFRDLKEEFAKLNTVIVGISKDTPSSHASFIKKYNLPFILLCDESTQMMQDYQAWGEKNMYGKITIGTIRSTVVIDENANVIKHWKKVTKAETHPEKVLEFLQSL